MSYSIQCVHCKAVLKSPKPVRGGKTLTCPNCKQPFTTPDEGRVTKADPMTELDTRPFDKQAPAPAPAASDGLFGDDMDAAIAKLEAEQSGGKKPASAPSAPAAPAPPASPPAPASAASSDDDEMAAAIAKLEAEQSGGKKPAPAPTTADAPSSPPARTASSDDDDEMNAAIAKLEAAQSAGKAPAPPPPKKSIPKLEIPDAADDLVLPEHRAEPRAKKKRRDEEDDEPPAKKKRRDEDEDEDDEPRAKKKRRDEEEDEVDDEPRAKKKRRDEEEDDDEPPAKKKRRDEDDEDIDDDDEPRSAGKMTKKKSGSSMLMILLGGALLVLFGCCGCGVGGYFLFGAGFGPPDVVGRWENDPNDNLMKARSKIEFRPDGTGEVDVMGRKQWFKYEMNGAEMTWLYTHIEMGVGGGKLPVPDLPHRIQVQRLGNTLRMTHLDGEMKGRVKVYFKAN